MEIARFLRCRPPALVQLLRKEGLLKKLGMGGARSGIWYTTPRGLQIAIAHVRAKQGVGKDPFPALGRSAERRARIAAKGLAGEDAPSGGK